MNYKRTYHYKKGGSRLLALLLVFCMVLTTWNAGAFVTFAAAGETVEWDIGAEGGAVTAMLAGGVLTLSGYGDTKNYTNETAPFMEYAGEIESLVIEEGVTSLGDYLFYGLGGLGGELILPASLVFIGDNVFSGKDFDHAPRFTRIVNLFEEAEVPRIVESKEPVAEPKQPEPQDIPVEETGTKNAEGGDSGATHPVATSSDATPSDAAHPADVQPGATENVSIEDMMTPLASPSDALFGKEETPAAGASGTDEGGQNTSGIGPEEGQQAAQPSYEIETVYEQEIGADIFFPGQSGFYSCSEANETFMAAAEQAGYRKEENTVALRLYPGDGSFAEDALLDDTGAFALTVPAADGQITLPQLPGCINAPQSIGLTDYVFFGWVTAEDYDAGKLDDPMLPGETIPYADGDSPALQAVWTGRQVPLITSQTSVVLQDDVFHFSIEAAAPEGYALHCQWQISEDYSGAGEQAAWIDLEGENNANYLRPRQEGDGQRFFRCVVTAKRLAATFSLRSSDSTALSEASVPVAASAELQVTYYPGTGTAEGSQVKNYPAGTAVVAPYPVSLGFTAPAGQAFSHWSNSSDGNGTPYRAGEPIVANDGGASLELYAVWKASDQSLSVKLYNKNRTSHVELTENGALVDDWSYKDDVRYLVIKPAGSYNTDYTIHIDLPVGMAIYGGTDTGASYTQADDVKISKVEAVDNDYSVVTADVQVQNQLKTYLKNAANQSESADLTYTVKAGEDEVELTVPVIYDPVLWDKHAGSNVTGDLPAIQVTMTRGESTVTKTLAEVKALHHYGGISDGKSIRLYLNPSSTSFTPKDTEIVMSSAMLLSSSQENTTPNYWADAELEIKVAVMRDNKQIEGLYPIWTKDTADNLSPEISHSGYGSITTYHWDEFYGIFTRRLAQPHYIVKEIAYQHGDILKFTYTITLTSWTGTQFTVKESRSTTYSTKETLTVSASDFSSYAPHNSDGTLGYMGTFQINNTGIDTGPRKVEILFDTERANHQRISAVRLPLPTMATGKSVEVSYQLVDENGENSVEGTTPVTNPNISYQGALLAIEDLGNEAKGKYFKSITYTIPSIPAGDYLYNTSGNKGGASGGTCWGTIGEGSVINQITLTPVNENGEPRDGETYIKTMTATGKPAAEDSIVYIATAGVSPSSLEAGGNAEITMSMRSHDYPYGITGVIENAKVFFVAPKGVSLVDASVTSNNNAVGEITSRRLSDGRTIYTIPLENNFGGWYYNGAITSRPSVSMRLQLTTAPDMALTTSQLNSCLFVGSEGITNKLSGAAGKFRYPDTYGLISSAAEPLYIGGYSSDITTALTVTPAKNTLKVSADAKLDSEGGGAYQSGEDAPVYLNNAERMVDYRLRLQNQSSGFVLQDAVYYYIPIPRGDGESFDGMVKNASEFSMKLTGPVSITGSNPQIYDVRYSMDAASENYDNGKGDFDAADGFATYYTTQEMEDQKLNWEKVRMIKIVPISHIPAGTDDYFRLRLAFDGGSNSFTEHAGSSLVWRSDGFQSFAGPDGDGARTPTSYVSVRLKYQASTDVTLTAAVGEPTGEGSKTATVTLPAFAQSKRLYISKVETENVELVNSISDADKTGWASSKANNTFAIAIGNTPLAAGSELNLGSWTTTASQPFELQFTLDNANALNDVTTPRAVEVTLGGEGVEYVVKIAIQVQRAEITDPQSTVDVGKQYDLIGGSASSISVTDNSAVTAQFVLENMVPSSYSEHVLSWDDGAFPIDSTIVLVDLTDETPGYYYYKSTESDRGVVPLSSFVKMGAGGGYYTDRASGEGTQAVIEKLLFVVDLEQTSEKKHGSHTLTLTVAAEGNGVSNSEHSLTITTSPARSFSLNTTVTGAGQNGDMLDTATISGTVQPSGVAEDVLTSHQHQKLTLVISLQTALQTELQTESFPEGSMMTWGDEKYTLTSGRFIIPLGSVSSAHNFNMTLATPYERLAVGDYTIETALYVSGTANGAKPFGGSMMTKTNASIKVAAETAFALNVTGTKQILAPGDSGKITVEIHYNEAAMQSSASKPLVTFSVQKKSGNVYLSQSDLLKSVTTNASTDELLPSNGTIQAPGFLGEGTETVTIEFNTANLTSGTYRLWFRVSGNSGTVEVPYNFIVLE